MSKPIRSLVSITGAALMIGTFPLALHGMDTEAAWAMFLGVMLALHAIVNP